VWSWNPPKVSWDVGLKPYRLIEAYSFWMGTSTKIVDDYLKGCIESGNSKITFLGLPTQLIIFVNLYLNFHH